MNEIAQCVLPEFPEIISEETDQRGEEPDQDAQFQVVFL
jgi:hypothetical protein